MLIKKREQREFIFNIKYMGEKFTSELQEETGVYTRMGDKIAEMEKRQSEAPNDARAAAIAGEKKLLESVRQRINRLMGS